MHKSFEITKLENLVNFSKKRSGLEYESRTIIVQRKNRLVAELNLKKSF